MKRIHVKVNKSDIVATHRLGRFVRNSNRSVIVKFVNRKHAILALRYKSKLQKINEFKKINIRENLCPQRKFIFNRLYKKLKNNEIEDVWSENGNIYCIFEEGGEPTLIELEDDIEFFINEIPGNSYK